MTDVAPGIITFGLGGDQSNLILGNILNLGFFKVEIGVGSPIGGSPFPGPGGSPIIGGSPVIGGSPIGGSPSIPPIPPVIPPGVSGGSRPLMPGEIQNFYKVVDNEYQVPYEYPNEKKVPVRIKVTFRGQTTEKYYLVNPKRGDIIVNVLNVVNRIRDRIKIVVKNIRSGPKRIVAFVRNLRKSDED